MAKRKEINDKQIVVGAIVAFSSLKEAAWFEIVEREGFLLRVREAGTDYACQMADTCFVAQIK